MTNAQTQGNTQRWYNKYIIWIRHHKLLVAIFSFVVLILAGTVIVQLAYPAHTTLPYASFYSKNIGRKSYEELANTIQQSFETAEVAFVTGDKVQKTKLTTIGAMLDSDRMIQRLTEYPLWQRLVPFSILYYRTHVNTYSLYFMSAVRDKEVATIAGQLSAQPGDARLAIVDGSLAVTAAKSGREVNTKDLSQAVSETEYSQTTTIVVPSKVLEPARSDIDIAPIRTQAESIINKVITLTFADNTTQIVDKKTVASWVNISDTMELSVDTARISAYLAEIAGKIDTASVPTQVVLVDGSETGRIEGSNGHSLDIVTTADLIAKAVQGSETSGQVKLQIADTAPTITYVRSYGSSQAGLQAYVNYASAAYDTNISIVQLDGNGWTAGAHENESIPSASTYKLFVALVLFDKINKGEIHWSDPILDTNVEGCFERMIVPSTNQCAEEWIARFGRNYINDFIYARGFSSGTTFTAPDATHTTAADLTRYLIGLNDGSLVSGNNRDMLMSRMARQLYRYGIPTGSNGTQVWDKVGYLWGYIHDTAIVYHPKGKYVMTVMTQGQSYARIAEITRQVEQIMYP